MSISSHSFCLVFKSFRPHNSIVFHCIFFNVKKLKIGGVMQKKKTETVKNTLHIACTKRECDQIKIVKLLRIKLGRNEYCRVSGHYAAEFAFNIYQICCKISNQRLKKWCGYFWVAEQEMSLRLKIFRSFYYENFTKKGAFYRIRLILF